MDRIGLLGVGFAFAAAACGEPETGTWSMRPITADHSFPARDAGGAVIPGGVLVSALDLDEGRMGYVDFCASCHGLNGDGKGHAAKGLDPPPRDFRTGQFKFAGVRSGELPSDDDLMRVVRHGLTGTQMPPWGLDERDLRRIVHFVKTFPLEGQGASRWTRPKAAIGVAVRVPEDAWRGRQAEAAKKGEELYHLQAQCSSCHPSYLTKDELSALSSPSPRARMHESVPLAADKNPYRVAIRPPDFTSDPLRSIRAGHESEDTYRVIAAGVGGVMPAWVDALSPRELWALTRYVRSLSDLRNSERTALRKKLGLGQ